LYENEMTERVN